MNDVQQINECIDEMAKLKEKMEERTILNDSNETIKKRTMKPNLKVLEDWLHDYREAIETNKINHNKNNRSYRKYSYDIIKVVRSPITGKPTGSYYNEPSEFMEAHIEATLNMFNIINKRLDDIEKRIR